MKQRETNAKSWRKCYHALTEPRDGCHFSKAGYENMANRILPVVSRDFYGVVPASAITAPISKRAYFTSAVRTAIALEFDQPMRWSSYSTPNYYVNDAADLVSSGSASGNIVTLQLASAADASATPSIVRRSHMTTAVAPFLMAQHHSKQ